MRLFLYSYKHHKERRLSDSRNEKCSRLQAPKPCIRYAQKRHKRTAEKLYERGRSPNEFFFSAALVTSITAVYLAAPAFLPHENIRGLLVRAKVSRREGGENKSATEMDFTFNAPLLHQDMELNCASVEDQKLVGDNTKGEEIILSAIPGSMGSLSVQRPGSGRPHRDAKNY